MSQNSRGEDEITWTKVADAWAEVLPLSGNELVLARQQAARVTHSVRTRGRLAIKSQGRFVAVRGLGSADGERLLYVESSLDGEERRIERVSLCREETE